MSPSPQPIQRTRRRAEQLTGLLFVVLGACSMIWWRLSPQEASRLALAAGLGGVVFGWGLILHAMATRWREERDRLREPPRETASSGAPEGGT
ncbi:MAG: hypothetical protein EBS42_16880 [Caulobacteraceae bacterium]|nr:hypothetical protein [Caulobacteraceae bacterium]